MRRYLFASSLSLALAARSAAPSHAAPAGGCGSVRRKSRCSTSRPTPLTGKIIATFPKPGADGVSARYIYLTQLGTGLGSAPIGLDRAAASETRILVFRRIGKKVAAEVENSKFVASSGDPDEQRAVDTSFATSTLWMGDVVEHGEGRFLHRRPVGLPRARRPRHSAGDQARRRGRFQVRPRAQRGRSQFREGLPEERRVRREARPSAPTSRSPKSATSSRRQHADAGRCAIR